MKIITFIVLTFFLLGSCSRQEDNNSLSNSCDIKQIEDSLSQYLSTASTDSDFSFYIEREDGQNYLFNRGTSSMNTVYESASTSKWVSAAIILWAVENISGFDLDDIPSDHYTWSMPIGESVYNTKLSQLLSFTSGLQGEANCLKFGVPAKTYDNCINDAIGSIVSVNIGNGYTPGSSFHYSSSHLQVAGAMAISASGEASWQDLFASFKVSTGLFSSSNFSLPSVSNPRLSGGMTWAGNDYIGFLRALYQNQIFSQSLRNEMFKDGIANLSVSYSPAFDGLGEQWHYGFGVWLECPNNTFNCSNINYYSSPGAYGSYPFINLNKKFFGILARQGALGTYTNGVILFRSIQTDVEKWADCN
jgi:CubicO group peptidase (beta-lactamase class C family)